MLSEKGLSLFEETMADLLRDPQVRSMQQWRHHFDVTCFEHSVFVAYTAFRLAPFFRTNPYLAARAGLLHDLYLYSPYDSTSHPGNQCFYHPVAALRNARALVPGLTGMEQNAILTHMWPLARHMPRCRLALVINLADKFCATLEVSKIYHLLKLRQQLPTAA